MLDGAGARPSGLFSGMGIVRNTAGSAGASIIRVVFK